MIKLIGPERKEKKMKREKLLLCCVCAKCVRFWYVDQEKQNDRAERRQLRRMETKLSTAEV